MAVRNVWEGIGAGTGARMERKETPPGRILTGFCPKIELARTSIGWMSSLIIFSSVMRPNIGLSTTVRALGMSRRETNNIPGLGDTAGALSDTYPRHKEITRTNVLANSKNE